MTLKSVYKKNMYSINNIIKPLLDAIVIIAIVKRLH